MDDRISMEDFIKANQMSISSVRVDENPHMDSQDMDHWKCTLRAGKSRMTVYFSQGYGHNGKEPKLSGVLSCLASDSSSVENNDFENWCADLGYDTNSRKAEKTYKICEKQAEKLREFLGDSAYETLLWKVEQD